MRNKSPILAARGPRATPGKQQRPTDPFSPETTGELEITDAAFRAFARGSSAPLGLLERDGTVRYANGAAADLLGRSGEDLIGRDIIDHVHPDDAVRCRSFFQEVLAHPGMPVTGEFQFQRQGGGWRSLEVFGMNRLEADVLNAVIVSFQDVTDRKLSEETRARLAAIVESSDDAIIGETLDGIVTTWNEAAERLYGYTAEEAIGRSIRITVSPDRVKELENYMTRVRRGDRVDHMETVRLRKDGTRLDVSITVSPIRDDSGQIIGLSKSSRDITERRRFEAELWRKNVELELASRAKDTFLASMSHELRTPLNSIIGFTGTLLMKLPGELTDDQERQLQLIQFSARHLLSLINDLLNLAKVQSGKAELHLEAVPVSGAVEEVAETLRPGAEGKGLAFEVELPEADFEIHTDRRSLVQILMNLTTNAIKFTTQGSICMKVERGRVGEVAFRVIDNGLGIRPDDQKRLFEAFEQLHPGGAQAEAGSGLGLHLSQRMANLLDGRIEVSSVPGQGSTFTLVLPER